MSKIAVPIGTGSAFSKGRRRCAVRVVNKAYSRTMWRPVFHDVLYVNYCRTVIPGHLAMHIDTEKLLYHVQRCCGRLSSFGCPVG